MSEYDFQIQCYFPSEPNGHGYMCHSKLFFTNIIIALKRKKSKFENMVLYHKEKTIQVTGLIASCQNRYWVCNCTSGRWGIFCKHPVTWNMKYARLFPKVSAQSFLDDEDHLTKKKILISWMLNFKEFHFVHLENYLFVKCALIWSVRDREWLLQRFKL